MKTCKNCGLEKPLDQYYTHPKTRDRKGSWCKSCLHKRLAEKRKDPEQRELWKEYGRRSTLKKRYGITVTDYDAMVEAQNGLCAICERKSSGGGRTPDSRLAVDHNHETGKVRALLCGMCNQGIGMFKEDVEIMQRAIDYLNSHRSFSSRESSSQAWLS